MATNTQINLSQSIQKAPYLKRLVKDVILPSPTYRYLNWGRNTKLSKCIGLIGPRGSGKSESAAGITIMDYLVPGYDVISNMEIKWGMRLGDYIVGYASQELDKAAFLNLNIKSNRTIVVDEVNIEFSEARRSLTNRNLIFNKIIQLLRKKQLNLIYTVQHEMWIDNRLRWQTDIFIKCQDVCMRPGGFHLPFDFGEQVSWRIYDISGMLGHGAYGETGIPVAEDLKFLGKQWWNTFDTGLIQGEDEVTYGSMQLNKSKYVKGEIDRYGWVMDKITELILDGSRLTPKFEIAEDDLLDYLNNYGDTSEALEFLNQQGIRTRFSGGLKRYRLHNLARRCLSEKEESEKSIV